MPASMTGRLILLLAGGLGLIWLAGLTVAGLVVRREVNASLDSALMEMAQRLLPASLENLGGEPPLTGVAGNMLPAVPHTERNVYQVLTAAGGLVLRSHGAPEAPLALPLRAGFRNVPGYRVYTEPSVRGDYAIAVAEPAESRQGAVWRAMLPLALPLLGMLPACWLLIGWAVRHSTRPVTVLGEHIGRRDGTNLAPIPPLDLPRELAPFHAAVNRLLERLGLVLAQERQFAANSAHELRTPIAAALAQAQLLAAEAAETPHLARASLLVDRLRLVARLVEKLLQLSRAEAGLGLHREPVELLGLLRLLVAELAGHPTVGTRLRLEVAGLEALWVAGELDALAILLRNLIDNALRHGTSGTPVLVRVTPDRQVAVLNQGPVVPAAMLAGLSRPFQRGASNAEGTGLGLAIADTIARQLGARLSLASPAPGQPDGFQALLALPPP